MYLFPLCHCFVYDAKEMWQVTKEMWQSYCLNIAKVTAESIVKTEAAVRDTSLLLMYEHRCLSAPDRETFKCEGTFNQACDYILRATI